MEVAFEMGVSAKKLLPIALPAAIGILLYYVVAMRVPPVGRAGFIIAAGFLAFLSGGFWLWILSHGQAANAPNRRTLMVRLVAAPISAGVVLLLAGLGHSRLAIAAGAVFVSCLTWGAWLTRSVTHGSLAGRAISSRRVRLRKRVALTKEEFARRLELQAISTPVADAVYDYYRGLVGGQVQLHPEDTREELAGSGWEDSIDDARLILRELSIDRSFDELERVAAEESLELKSLEQVAQLVQFVQSQSRH